MGKKQSDIIFIMLHSPFSLNSAGVFRGCFFLFFFENQVKFLGKEFKIHMVQKNKKGKDLRIQKAGCLILYLKKLRMISKIFHTIPGPHLHMLALFFKKMGVFSLCEWGKKYFAGTPDHRTHQGPPFPNDIV